MLTQSPHGYPLVAHFAQLVGLTENERAALASLPVRIVGLKADQDIVREGDKPSRCAIVLEGLACTSKVTSRGKQQISAFHIAGSWPDLESLHLEVLDSDIRTVTECVVAFLDHTDVRALCEGYLRLAALLWRTTLVDASVYREWTTNIGQREALSRIAHVFCEMMVRMDDVGLAKDNECSLPLTQIELGEATGLSTVHVNRTLQALREAGLIEFKAGRLRVLDWDGLAKAGEFYDAYLHRPKARNGAQGRGN